MVTTGRLKRCRLFQIWLSCGAVLLTAGSCSQKDPAVAANYTYKVVNAYPHDTTAFTQGLVFEDGAFYEGTGLRGASTIRKVELKTGKVTDSRNLDPSLFGEGVTILGNRIFQITLDAQKGFIYDIHSLEQTGEFSYATKGWGLTNDGTNLIMSDGSAKLYFLAPKTFERVGELEVRSGDEPISGLNELEYIDGEIYANIWLTDSIVRISAETGRVTGWIDLTGLLPMRMRRSSQAVLNGIAYDVKEKRLFVTGKLWPNVFEIKLIRSK